MGAGRLAAPRATLGARLVVSENGRNLSGPHSFGGRPMPRYFFSLDHCLPPPQAVEELPDDEAAAEFVLSRELCRRCSETQGGSLLRAAQTGLPQR
jgi:hypothetical protein